MQRTIHIIYASTSGHTEFVVETLSAHLIEKNGSLKVTRQRAEEAQLQDLNRGDALLLASGTWNTGGVEGQLNPHMHELLKKRAATAHLRGKPCAIIALGDNRYFYTARANEHLATFVLSHKGTSLLPPLTIINEPYEQGDRIRRWGDELLKHLKTIPQTSIE